MQPRRPRRALDGREDILQTERRKKGYNMCWYYSDKTYKRRWALGGPRHTMCAWSMIPCARARKRVASLPEVARQRRHVGPTSPQRGHHEPSASPHRKFRASGHETRASARRRAGTRRVRTRAPGHIARILRARWGGEAGARGSDARARIILYGAHFKGRARGMAHEIGSIQVAESRHQVG